MPAYKSKIIISILVALLGLIIMYDELRINLIVFIAQS